MVDKDRLYLRRAKITVNDRSVETDGSGGLRMSFQVRQSVNTQANTATASIFNLTPDTQEAMSSLDRAQFLIEAGYGEDTTTLFKGETIRVSTFKSIPGFQTDILAADGSDALMEKINFSIGKGATLYDVIKKITAAMKLNINAASEKALKEKTITAKVETFAKGISISGIAQQVMDKVAQSLDLSMSIQDGELHVMDSTLVVDGVEQGVLMHRTTGMIGSPKRVFSERTQVPKLGALGRQTEKDALAVAEARTKAEKEAKLVKLSIQSLLNPNIRPNRRISLVSELYEGDFKVLSVVHSGDTHEGDWRSDMEVIAI